MPAECFQSTKVLGLLGILNIYHSNHLVVIMERNEMLRMDTLDQKALPSIVYELKEIQFFQFDRMMTKGKQQECAPVLDKIHKYITYGTFYGFNFDLTRSQQA